VPGCILDEKICVKEHFSRFVSRHFQPMLKHAGAGLHNSESSKGQIST